MSNTKCAQCGLVNWSSEVECKRCGSLLTVQNRAAQNIELDSAGPPPLFSGGVKFLTIVLALATVCVLLSRILHVLEGDVATTVAATFMVVGILLLLLTHVWLLVRIFEQSIGWGVGALFVPLVGLIAVAMFWDKTKRSFVGQLVCLGIMFVGYQIVPPSLRSPTP